MRKAIFFFSSVLKNILAEQDKQEEHTSMADVHFKTDEGCEGAKKPLLVTVKMFKTKFKLNVSLLSNKLRDFSQPQAVEATS